MTIIAISLILLGLLIAFIGPRITLNCLKPGVKYYLRA